MIEGLPIQSKPGGPGWRAFGQGTSPQGTNTPKSPWVHLLGVLPTASVPNDSSLVCDDVLHAEDKFHKCVWQNNDFYL